MTGNRLSSRMVLALVIGFATCAFAMAEVRVGSKVFTESVILGEIIRTVGNAVGTDTEHRAELGGTGLVWKALLAGDIDLYPDYTGTIAESILQDESITDHDDIARELAKNNIGITRSLGFENTYALGMRTRLAKQLNVQTISDLKKHRQLKFGFGNEFMDRRDGWPSLRKKYQLAPSEVTGLDHMLAYRAIESGDIDVMDVYTTDANIRQYDITLLEDDLDHFPNYNAVILFRKDLVDQEPQFFEALRRLEGAISVSAMRQMNELVDIQGKDETVVAAQFAKTIFVDRPEVADQISAVAESRLSGIWKHTWEHLFLVAVSLTAAIFVAIPLGIVAAKNAALGQIILTTAEIIQTIPGLAMLILVMSPLRMIGFSVVGPAPAIVALFLYSLLPIIRNTFTGLQNIPKSMRESAEALGLSAKTRLWKIELPLASRTILAGIKTTAVINVGYATLGGLIGAGGYGQLIMQGLRKSSEAKMLEGAIPAAVLALLVKFLFEAIEKWVVPEGLKA